MANSVLLVDDMRMFVEIEKEFLQYAMVDILTAKDGLEALDIVKAKRPDIVFMDLEMPRMDGAASCRAIKADPSILDTPVVMVTAKGNEESKEMCYSAGCDHFLTKPLDRDVFLSVARMFMPSIDRREKRVPVDIDGMLRCHDETISVHIRDLSSGGAFVVADCIAFPGKVIQLSFALPDGTKIDCPGRIAWVNGMGSKYHKGFGIKFALMPKNVKTCLNRFLDAVE